MVDLTAVLKALPGFFKRLFGACKRAARRAYQMYFKPLDMFEEIRVAPDALGPGILLVIAFSVQTAIVAALLAKILLITPEGKVVDLLANFYNNVLAYVAIRGATLFSTWFIFFIIFWFIMYLLGSRIEGFTVFSATGYVLSSQLFTFSAVFVAYAWTASITPTITLRTVEGVYPKYQTLTAYLYRFDIAGEILGVPLERLVDGIEYFGSVWNALLTILMFKIVGDLDWKKAVAGGTAGAVAAWVLASIFRAAGML